MFYGLTIGLVDSSKGRGVNNTEVTVSNGVATMFYLPLSGELCKPPEVDDLVISANGAFAVGTTLTATLTGHVNGPFLAGTHQYQWYRLSSLSGGTLTAISGATSSTYTLVSADATNYIVCAARYAQTSGGNSLSVNGGLNTNWFPSEATAQIAAAPGGDIVFTWEDHFDFTSTDLSVPTNANTAGESSSYRNLVSGGENWIGSATYKPSWDGSNLVFDKALSQRIQKPSSVTHPPKFETWMIIEFTATGGQAFNFGSNNLLGLNASTQFTANGMPNQTGSLTQRAIRLVRNGASSIFQVDRGAEVIYTDSTSTSQYLLFGTTYTGGAPASFKLKKFWRTPYNSFLNSTQASDRWTFLGY